MSSNTSNADKPARLTGTDGNTSVVSASLLVAFILSAAATLFTFAQMHAAHNAHASIAYVLLLYSAVLVFLIGFWRVNQKRRARPLRPPSLLIPTLLVFAVSACGLRLYTAHSRSVTDEGAYEFQARIFASGKLKAEPMFGATGVTSTTPPEIYFEQTIQSPQGWVSKYPPGWPLVLALGYLLHCPWLINPMLGLIQLLLLWRLAQPWGRMTQNLTVLSVATSSFFLFTNVGYMSHSSDAVVCLGALAFLLQGVRERRLSLIGCCFLLVVAATQIRPYTGAVLGLLCAGYALQQLWSDRAFLVRTLAVIAGCGGLAVAAFLAVNLMFTGKATTTLYALARGGSRIRELTLNPVEIGRNIATIWRWAITDTLRVTFPFLILFAVYAFKPEKVRRPELLCLFSLLPLLVAAYLLQTEGSGSVDGERFYYEGFGAFSIVAARGLVLLLAEWQVSVKAAASGLAVLMALQVATVAFTLEDIRRLMGPVQEAYALSHHKPPMPLVLMADHSPEFTPKHVNWNEANWKEAPTVYLNDPGVNRRARLVCEFGRNAYRLIEFDPHSGHMIASDHQEDCKVKP